MHAGDADQAGGVWRAGDADRVRGDRVVEADRVGEDRMMPIIWVVRAPYTLRVGTPHLSLTRKWRTLMMPIT